MTTISTEELDGIKSYYTEKCKKAELTPEQTAQVIDFRLDPWWCNDDRQADTIIDFLHRLNDVEWERKTAVFEADLATLHVDCGNALCPDCGDVRDTSAVRS